MPKNVAKNTDLRHKARYSITVVAWQGRILKTFSLRGTAHQELRRVSNKTPKTLNIEPPNLEQRKLKAPANPPCFVENGQYIAGKTILFPHHIPFEAWLANDRNQIVNRSDMTASP
jgi:hypothetical protein